MNVALNIKKFQLRGVLEELGKIGKDVEVAVNIDENKLKEEVFKENEFKEGSESLIREELEMMQREMKEKVHANIDA